MLYGWMKSIIVYLILSGILINLAPGGNYKKYIHFFTGLLLIFIILEPILYLFKVDVQDMDRVLEYIDRDLENYNYNQRKENTNYFEISLSDSILWYAGEEGLTAFNVQLITDDEYKIIKCTINYKKEDGNNVELDQEDLEHIKNKISDVYNVEKDNIYIVNR